MGKTASGKVIATGQGYASVTGRVKSNLSRRHLFAADYFASQCETIEAAEMMMAWPQPSWEELQSYSAAAVILAVAALEASVNELYLEAVDRHKSALESLSEEQMALIGERWPAVDRSGILRKYQVVLAACSKTPMETDVEPYQSASALITLRNTLTHFKPEWDNELDRHQRIEDALRGRFTPNKLAERASGHMVWFPHRCLGAGCARWACDTAQKFTEAFCSRLGVRERLT